MYPHSYFTLPYNAGKVHRGNKSKKAIKIEMWNVEMLQHCGKLAQALGESDEYQLDIFGISKMKWTGSGKMHDARKTILCSGHSEQNIQGIGIVLNKESKMH